MKFNYKELIDEVSSKNFWSRLAIVIISVLVLAINYNTFLLYNNLAIGGTSGIATILHTLININPAIFIFVTNIILVVISFFFLGPKSTGLTIIGSILYPIFVSLTEEPCLHLAENLAFDNFLIVVIISALLFGTANGFLYKIGFSTGGTDIIIQLFNKYLKIPTGTASFIIYAIIIAFGAVVFGINNAVYSIIIVAINGFLVDKIMLGISNSKMFYIHSKKVDEITSFIQEIQSGYTIMHTKGGYTKEENNLIMCVVPTKDYYMFKSVVEKIDPEAFFIISDCYEVYGGRRKEQFPFL